MFHTVANGFRKKAESSLAPAPYPCTRTYFSYRVEKTKYISLVICVLLTIIFACAVIGKISVSSGAVPILTEIEDSEGPCNSTEKYVLLAGGKVIDTSDSYETLQSAVSTALDKYKTENTTQISFGTAVTIEFMQVGEEATEPHENAVTALLSTVLPTRTETVSYTKEVPYEVEYVDDKTQYVGTETIKTAGSKGLYKVTEEVSYYGDTILSRTVLSQDKIADVQNEVVYVGVLVAGQSTGKYIWPITSDFVITSYFGPRNGRGIISDDHTGIDLCGTYGENIYASDGGTVSRVEHLTNSYGNFVVILHENGDRTYYAHCSEILVNVGDKVTQGQLIAKIGNSGTSTGAHLHFELRPAGQYAVDPLPYLPSRK